MDRLTQKTIGCFQYSLKNHKAEPGEFGTYDAFFNYSTAVKRLGKYEDTGLEPDEIPHWVSVSERLPEPEERVLTCAETHCQNGKTYRHIAAAMYEDGNMWRENSSWNFNDFDNLENYDEERDDYKIPEGWWECNIYNDEEGNYPIDDFVTHWMPLPQPPKGEKQ